MTAPRPCHTERMVRVDVLVLNRHRQVREWNGLNWRHCVVRKREFTSTWWVSWYDWLPLSVPGGILVNRGWNTFNPQRLAPGSEGWSYRADGYVVVATELRFVDSPYDFEVRHRQLCLPYR